MVNKKISLVFLLSLIILFSATGLGSAAITNIEVIKPNGGEYWSGVQDIEWSAIGQDGDTVDILWSAGGLWYYIDSDVPYNAGSYLWETSSVSDGDSYYIKVKSTSVPLKSDISNFAFTTDNTLPTITDNYVNDGTWITSAQTVVLNPLDANGIASVLTCEGSGCTPSTVLASPYELTYSTSQDTIVRYQAFDIAGNPSAIGEFNVKIDLTNPVASVTGAPLGLIVDTTGVTATISCEDDTSGCIETKYTVYTTDPGTCSLIPEEYITGTSVGITDHSWVCAYAKDKSGNKDFSDPIEFNIFNTIQGAINAASSGDTININTGTYPETLDINIPLILIGESRAETIIDASGSSDYGISITADNVTIESLTLLGPNNYGFKPSHISNLVLRDLLVQGSGKTGIDLNTIGGAELNNIEITDTGWGFGLMILDSNDVIVTDITTSENAWGGVSVQTAGSISDSITFSGNFDVQENLPLLLEKDPSTYYDITNVNIPDKFEYLVYDFREGDNYKQWYYFETLEEAKSVAQAFVDSKDPIYSDILVYDIAEEDYYVEPGMKIQDAVIDATAGDTINIAAGIYDEQVIIDKSLTLQGTGDTTIIKPSQTTANSFTLFNRLSGGATNTVGIIVTNAASDSQITIKNLKVDGSLVSSTPSNARFIGILYRGDSGLIDSVTVEGININEGNAVYLSGYGSPVNVEVKNSIVSGYLKNGITANNPGLTANIHDNTITGMGPTNSIAQNGIQIGFGAVGIITNNIISGNVWTDTYGGSNDPTTDVNADGATGILLYMSGTSAIEISDNTLTANQFGIWTVAASNVNIHDNTITGLAHIGDAFPTGIAIWDSDMWTDYFEGTEQSTVALVNNNKITNNDYGIIARDYTPGGAIPSVDATQNYWGTAVESNIQSLISGNVDYSPYYINEEMTLLSNVSVNEVYVDDDYTEESCESAEYYFGYNCFDHIQDAIDAVSEGGTVNVAAGLYSERIIINKPLTLRGATYDINKNGYVVPDDYAWDENIESMIQNPEPALQTSNVVDIVSDDVVFEGFVVQSLNALTGSANDHLLRLDASTGTANDGLVTDETLDNIIIRNNMIGPNTNINSQVGTSGRMGLYFASPTYLGDEKGITNTLVTGNKIIDALGNGNNIFVWGAAKSYNSPANADYTGTVIEDNEISGSHRSGIEVAGGVSNLVIRNNWIHDQSSTNGGSEDPNIKYGNGILFIRMGSDKTYADAKGAENILIENNIIENNEKNALYFGPFNKDITVQNNKITNNGLDAVQVDLTEVYHSGNTNVFDVTLNINFNNNNLLDNAFGARVVGTPTNGFVLDAEDNWWGHITGPSGVGTGKGDAVSDYVDYKLWWVTETGGNDVTKPESNITLIPTTQYITSFTFNLPYTASDDYGLKRILLYENGDYASHFYNTLDYPTSYSGSFSETVDTDGTYTYYTRAKDVIDNVEDAPLVPDVTIIVDTTNPVVTINAVTSPTKITTQTITGTFIETNINTIIVNGVTATLGAGTYSAVIPLTEGVNNVTVTATDKVGRTGQISTSVILDTQGPTFSDVSPGEDISIQVGESVTLTATVTDENSEVVSVSLYDDEGLRIDDLTNIGDNLWSFTSDPFDEKGNYKYYLIAEDEVGNQRGNPENGDYTLTVHDLIWDLESEWNLVSVPKELVDDSVLANTMWGYDGIGWVTPTTIEAGVGYWINNAPLTNKGLDYDEDCSGPLCLPSGDIDLESLQPQWNLIGITTTDTNKVVSDVFQSPLTQMWVPGLFYVVSYDEGNEEFEFLDASSPIKPGEGYWVYKTQ